MERVVTVHKSFEEADKADRDFYRRLTPSERLEILLELNRRFWGIDSDDETAQRLQRVYRITQFP